MPQPPRPSLTLLARARFLFRAWRYRYRLDAAEIAYLCAALRQGDIAFDIGSHKGAYAYWMSRQVGVSGQVYCFEPQSQLAEELRKIRDGWPMPNIIVEELALSSTEGERLLIVPGSCPSPGATLESGLVTGDQELFKTPTTTLDSYVAKKGLDRVRFIKCDVEGHELDVFLGGQKTLSDLKPLLLFECEERHHRRSSMSDVFAFLTSKGYEGFFFDGAGKRPIAEFDPNLHGKFGGERYVNNFVFEPRGA